MQKTDFLLLIYTLHVSNGEYMIIKKIFHRNLSYLIMISSGLGSVLIGILVIVGWHIQNVRMIQVLPVFVPMQYNTAIGFLLCGVGIIFRVYNLPRISAICGATVITLGFLTLVQYIFGLDLGIDQFFMSHYITVETSHPGRMAPNTAVCFILSGAVLLIMSILCHQKYHSMITALLSSTISSFGMVAFFGYLFNIEPAYGWGYLTSMAVHTAVGFIIFSAGIIAYAWSESIVQKQKTPRWLPIIICIGLVTLTLFLWQALEQREQAYVSRSNELRAKSLKIKTEEILQSRVLALKRMAQRWEMRGRTPKEEWESDATNYVNQHPVYQAIEWADSSFHVRWIVPFKGNENAQDLNLVFEENRRIALEQARDLRKMIATRSIDLVQGGKGFLVFVPIYLKEGFDGMILGVFRIQKLFDMVMLTTELSGYSFAVFDGENQIYGKNVQNNPHTLELGLMTDIKCLQINFSILSWPSPELFANSQSIVPETTLCAGLLISFLFSLTVYLAQMASIRSKQVEFSNQEIRKEVIVKKQILEELLESRNQFKMLAHVSPSIIFQTDAQGKVVYVNKRWSEITGMPEISSLYDGWTKVLHPDDRKKTFRSWMLAVRDKSTWQHEFRFKQFKGDIIWVFAQAVPLQSKEGEIIGFIGICTDITERKMIEGNLRKLNIKLQEQDNMKSEFVSIVSHEIRTPLSIILGFASIINKRFKKIIVPNVNVVGSKVEESLTKTQNDLDLIISESKRLSNLLHDLLDIAKIESGKVEWNMKDVSVVEVVERAIKVTTSLFEQNSLEIIKDFEDKLPVIVADKDRLVQVMINLITNAIKFTNKGSITCRISKQDSEIVVSVIDTGMGIEEVDQEKIFAKFSQVRKTIAGKQKGTGLGLSICQHVVESHGGRIWVESKPGKGSIFSFALPISCGCGSILCTGHP